MSMQVLSISLRNATVEADELDVRQTKITTNTGELEWATMMSQSCDDSRVTCREDASAECF